MLSSLQRVFRYIQICPSTTSQCWDARTGQGPVGLCKSGGVLREEVGLDAPGPQGLSRDGAGLQARLRFNAVSCNNDVNN